MKPIVLTCAVVLFMAAGCTSPPPPPPEKTLDTSNQSYKVEQLFTDADGTKVYRFWSFGDWRYYTYNPRGVSQIMPTTKIVTEVETDTEIVDSDDHHDHHDHNSGGGGGSHGGGQGGGGHSSHK